MRAADQQCHPLPPPVHSPCRMQFAYFLLSKLDRARVKTGPQTLTRLPPPAINNLIKKYIIICETIHMVIVLYINSNILYF